MLASLSDFHGDREVFDLALEIAIALGARLDLVHCREHPEEAARTMSSADLELLTDVARVRLARLAKGKDPMVTLTCTHARPPRQGQAPSAPSPCSPSHVHWHAHLHARTARNSKGGGARACLASAASVLLSHDCRKS